MALGEVVEWLKAPASKAGERDERSESSNLSLSEVNHMAAKTPSELIDRHIAAIADWRGKTLADVRKIILAADPKVVEEFKWMGSPCWYHDGIILVANAHKDKVKLTFANGASLPDPNKIFNNGLGGNKWRSIDLYEGDKIDARALKGLIVAAVAHNQARLKKKAPASARTTRSKARKK